MSNTKKVSSRKISNDLKIKYAIDFIEELSWLLESKKSLDVGEIPSLLRSKLSASGDLKISADKYVSPNPNIHYLIGVLPRLFQDSSLFLTNEDIAEFAKEVLHIEISRVEKRSKYELIGLVVCETNRLDDYKLESLVTSLSAITDSKEKIQAMANEKKLMGFSWNEAIRNLASQND